MVRFIWQNWWRRKERLILLIIGALIISSGLSYLVGMLDTNKTTIVDELQKRWSSSYDIVVRPPNTRSETEENNLLDPNFLSGINGGISLEQYEQIKAMEHIDIAAPISMIGYTDYSLYLESLTFNEDGIYRVTEKRINDDGIRKTEDVYTSYIPGGRWEQYVNEALDKNIPLTYMNWSNHMYLMRSMLLAAIDPEQEAQLIGIDKAILPVGNSRYFTAEDKARHEPVIEPGDDGEAVDEVEEQHITSFPVIINTHSFADQEIHYHIEKLDIPFDSNTALKTLEDIDQKGGKNYLNSLKGNTVTTYEHDEQELFSQMINSIAGIDHQTGEPVSENITKNKHNPFQMDDLFLVSFASPLEYDDVSSPFPEKWPFAYRIRTFTDSFKDSFKEGEYTTFRRPFAPEFANAGGFPRMKPIWIGFYDAEKVNISKDPTNELPMETYRPASAELVLDGKKQPINPPQILKPTYDPFGYLANPPTMLTTLDAAEYLLGDKPISAIRIKVSEARDLSEDSQAMIEKVAKKIEQKTGLITDITLGSSPQPTLVHVPQVDGQEELGWFQQPWIRLYSSITIFREAKMGFSMLIFCIMAVAIIYVWASSFVSVLARRKEFAVLQSVGWRPQQLRQLIFIESAIIGSFVAFVSWLILGFIYIYEEATLNPTRFLLTGLIGFMIYILGAIIPAVFTQKIEPYETLQTGEISKTSKRFMKSKGIISMAWNHFIGKWKRNVLSIIAIALPTTLLTIFLFITFRLRGMMYLTWLGQYVALEIGPRHYIAVIVSLMIAVLTVAEIMWQNISERQEEMALLKALGWRNGSIRLLIWMEGLFSGLFAAMIGLSLALMLIIFMYQDIPMTELPFILATGLIPIIVGIIGTIIPAERTVRMSPASGMRGNYSNKKTSEKSMKWLLLTLFLSISALFVYLFVQILIS